jgi:hypothetical protein
MSEAFLIRAMCPSFWKLINLDNNTELTGRFKAESKNFPAVNKGYEARLGK